jgi:hypothetical protein
VLGSGGEEGEERSGGCFFTAGLGSILAYDRADNRSGRPSLLAPTEMTHRQLSRYFILLHIAFADSGGEASVFQAWRGRKGKGFLAKDSGRRRTGSDRPGRAIPVGWGLDIFACSGGKREKATWCTVLCRCGVPALPHPRLSQGYATHNSFTFVFKMGAPLSCLFQYL